MPTGDFPIYQYSISYVHDEPRHNYAGVAMATDFNLVVDGTYGLQALTTMKPIFEIKKEMHEILREVSFTKNDVRTRADVVRQLSDYLERLCIFDSIFDYLVVCDDSNNTQVSIEQNELHIDIDIAGTKLFGNEYRLHSVVVSPQVRVAVDYMAITRAIAQDME